jgi:hypothetical protein
MNFKFLILLISIFSFNNQENTKIEYKETKEKFLKNLENIWNCENVEIGSINNEFDSTKRDYLVINIKSEFDISEEEFEKFFGLTSSLLFKSITNTGKFKLAKVNFLNIKSKFKKSKIIYEIIDKSPVAKGCKENSTNNELKKCFNIKLMEHIKKKFKPSKFNNLGLAKKKHKIIINFRISKKGKSEVIGVKFPNETVKLEMTKLIESLKIKKPGFNNGKPVEVKYTIPINFIAE